MFLRSLAVALTLAASAEAQTFPEPLSDTLSDFADVLDATEEGRITRLLTDTRTATGVQMVVVTVPGLAADGGAGMTIEAYGKALFNAWGVGAAERNDGILLLLDTNRREARIALGEGYDPVYDGRAARVLSTAVLPALRDGNVATGIEAGIASARDRLITPFLAGQPVTVTDGFPDEGGSSPLTGLFGFGAVAAVAGYAFWRNRRARVTCPNCGAATLERNREIIDRPTRTQPGLGMQHLTCSACGFIDRKSYPISWSSAEARRDRDPARGRNDRGGGGNGGFGGGRSSGGGATGKW
jgi:uncharacterized protein